MTSLADFIQQLYVGSADPTTAYFLPSIILEQTLPADPLKVSGDEAWGDLAPLSASLPTALCDAISKGSICTPATQAAMSFSQLQVVGLSNVAPAQAPTVNGSRVTASFAFGGVTKLPPGIVVPPYLGIQGNFAVALSCCPSTDHSTCSGGPAPQPITGTFTAGFVGAVLQLGMDVDSSFAVKVSSLSLTARELKFAFQTDSPLIAAGPINTMLQAAFNGGATARALTIVNQRLSQPTMLAALSKVLTPAFQSLANPPLLAFVASTLYRYSVNPNSSYYLPASIARGVDPVLEPYSAGGWDMDDVGQWYPAAGGTICGSIGSTRGVLEIQTPNTKVPLYLTNIMISGTSNLLPVPMLTVGNSVYGIVACNAVASWPKTLTVSGDFTLGVTCCVTDRQRQDCTEPKEDFTGAGTFAAKFTAATVAVSVNVSASTNDDELTATVEAIYFSCDPNINNPKNITFDIDITSIPAGKREDWNNMVRGIFDSAKATSAIVDQVRDRMNGDQVRARLSDVVTKAIRSILGNDPELAARLRAEVLRRSSRA